MLQKAQGRAPVPQRETDLVFTPSELKFLHTANVSLKSQAPKPKHFQPVTGGKPRHPVIFTHAYTIQ